ncbi:hypothetical protein CDL12_09184 [Handroanthus impetiginosus]|uniref:Zinc knuckle CX2CX4HX4C domain-containing protein n=1 Tax=Handroanthus impetiginosus TaxID=429701 RepID=A0A2G9HKT7_9LAMI|nr:hypothetical protein CDL12_09184 [Handroanthus impetiginosus]
MRVKVGIDVSKSLRRGLTLRISETEKLCIDFIYERLPLYYYLCGLLGHLEKRFPVRHDDNFQDPGQKFEYGPWLVASETRSNPFHICPNRNPTTTYPSELQNANMHAHANPKPHTPHPTLPDHTNLPLHPPPQTTASTPQPSTAPSLIYMAPHLKAYLSQPPSPTNIDQNRDPSPRNHTQSQTTTASKITGSKPKCGKKQGTAVKPGKEIDHVVYHVLLLRILQRVRK